MHFLWCITQTSRDRDNSRRVRNTRKEPRRNCSPIGHNNTKHFLCPISSLHPLEFLEIVRWESVPRGSFARTWKLSSRPFSRPDWLPLGLRGWGSLSYPCTSRSLNRVSPGLRVLRVGTPSLGGNGLTGYVRFPFVTEIPVLRSRKNWTKSGIS